MIDMIYSRSYFVLLICMTGCNAYMPPNAPITVEIELGADLNSVHGVEWPLHDNQPFEFFPFSNGGEAFDVKVVLPSGRNIHSSCRLLAINQSLGRITRVTITPFEDLMQWSYAIDYFDQLSAKLELDKPLLVKQSERDEGVLITPMDRISNRVDIEKTVSLFVELKRHASGGGYYASLEYSLVDSMPAK
jgi:hypothetical protein